LKRIYPFAVEIGLCAVLPDGNDIKPVDDVAWSIAELPDGPAGPVGPVAPATTLAIVVDNLVAILC
jgi:hypothetical protein